MKLRLLGSLALGWCLMAAGAAGGALEWDMSRSRVEIAVDATAGSFVGTLAKFDAVVVVDPGTRRVRTAEVTFDFKDVKTGDEKRDRHMHDWQETETYPAGKFVMSALTTGEDGGRTVTGDLTFHGQTHAISFPVSVLTEGDTVVIEGRAGIDTRTFGLPIIRKFFLLKVNPVVGIDFRLEGVVAKSVGAGLGR